MGRRRSNDENTLHKILGFFTSAVDALPHLVNYIFIPYFLWQSFKAIGSSNSGDEKKWLKFWVLYFVIDFLESTFPQTFEWLPIWPSAKAVIICWLAYPGPLNGANYIYNKCIHPLLNYRKRVRVSFSEDMVNPFSKKPDDDHDD
ncbi:hypothetical protein DM860_000330 [Cuscuta australis]|uniref:HVA22-like protein n=1 Tax=Cuscuta australis TaxID=267555 RepID=A0A328CX10_9ASTE|nr:hypothetical protein DM860_000330 [Cuscuta australis]